MHLYNYALWMLNIKQGEEGAFVLELIQGVKGARSHSEWVLTYFQRNRSGGCRMVHHQAPRGPLYFAVVPRIGKVLAHTEFLEVQRPANNDRG